jgi:branched-subunit amino acid aminotransferase/4-amino-4-deoxychorismate lyase
MAAPDVASSGEMFLTNTLIGAWPVREVGDLRLPLGTVTREVQSLLAGSSADRFRV